MLSYTSPRATAKASKSEGMISIALRFPSFRSKLMRVFVVFLVKMWASRLCVKRSALLDRYVCNVMIFCCFPNKYSISRPIISSCFVLNPVYIDQFFQIFFVYVFVWFYNFFNVFSQSFLDVFVLRDIIDHHLYEMTSSIGSSCKKCAKLFNEFFEIIVLSIFFLDLNFTIISLLLIKTFF